MFRDKHPGHAINGKPALQLDDIGEAADAGAVVYYMALKARKVHPIEDHYLRSSAIWSFEDAGLIDPELGLPTGGP